MFSPFDTVEVSLKVTIPLVLVTLNDGEAVKSAWIRTVDGGGLL
jgi:hypothetical protein